MFTFGILFVGSLVGVLASLFWMRQPGRSVRCLEDARHRANELLMKERWDLAEKTLAPFIHARTQDPSLIVLYCRALRHRGKSEKATGVLHYFLQKFPHQLLLHAELGQFLVEMGNPKQALKHLLKAEPILLREEQKLALGLAWFQTGHVEQAWAAIEETAKASVHGHLLALAGDCHFHQGHIASSLAYYQRAARARWINESLLYRIGYCLRRLGRTTEARRYFRLILQRDTRHPQATLELAKCFQAENAFNRALIVLQSSNAWEDNHPEMAAQAGYYAIRLGCFDAAEQYLKEAIRSGLRTARILSHLAYNYECQRRWDLAEQVYAELVHRYPSHISGYRGLSWLFGVGLSHNLDAETGLAMAYHSLEQLPDRRAWELLSACEARAGNFDKACNIQEKLSYEEGDPIAKDRHRHAIQALRKGRPLDESHVAKALVA